MWGSPSTSPFSSLKGGDLLTTLQKRSGAGTARFFVAAIVFGLMWAMMPSAHAMTGYHIVRASQSVHAYNSPDPTSGWIASIAPGSEVDITCQIRGVSSVGTGVWNFVAGKGWVSNYYVSTESIVDFSPYLARCPNSSPNRETRALSRAAAMVGQVYQSDGNYWAGWCDRFVARLFGQQNSGYATALAHWSAMKSRGMAHFDANPKFGTMVFFNIGSQGHVAFALGDGTVISTPPNPGQAIFRVPLSYFGTSRILGWSYAQPSWNT